MRELRVKAEAGSKLKTRTINGKQSAQNGNKMLELKWRSPKSSDGRKSLKVVFVCLRARARAINL